MNNLIQNKITNYSTLSNDNGPISLNDYISNKYDNIHNELYIKALAAYFGNKINEYKLIEIKNKEWYLPSKVYVIKRDMSEEPFTYDLTPHWNNYQFNNDSKSIDDILIDDYSTKDAEAVYIDYLKGKVKMKSKLTGVEFWIPFDYVNSYTKINKERLTLHNTFSNLYNN